MKLHKSLNHHTSVWPQTVLHYPSSKAPQRAIVSWKRLLLVVMLLTRSICHPNNPWTCFLQCLQGSIILCPSDFAVLGACSKLLILKVCSSSHTSTQLYAICFLFYWKTCLRVVNAFKVSFENASKGSTSASSLYHIILLCKHWCLL